MTDANIRNLACAIIMQAVRDYFNSSDKGKQAILKDLRSSYMDFVTQGTSVAVADRLEQNPDEIYERIRRDTEEM